MPSNIHPVKYSQCPLCKDRGHDNLVTYSDGWEVCYAGHGIITKGGPKSWYDNREDTYIAMTIEEQLVADFVPWYENDDVDKWLNQYPLCAWASFGCKAITRGIYKTSKGKFIPVRNALYIPCGDGFIIRQVNGETPKVLSSQSKQVWCSINIDKRKLIIVEDVISAIQCWSQGYSALALMGTSLTDEAMTRLYSINQQKIIWLDSDEAGQRAAQKVKTQLLAAGLTSVNMVSDKDPKYYSNITEVINEYFNNH